RRALTPKPAGPTTTPGGLLPTHAEPRKTTRVRKKRWLPRVVTDVHKRGSAGPRQFVPPYKQPTNPNIEALLHQSLVMIGARMSLDLARHGKKGVISNAMFDLWWSGSFCAEPRMHNMVAVLSETA